MWPLRQNVQYNKRCFFKEILAFVFVVHLILLGLLFVCDTGKFHQERFVLNTNNLQSTVVFMPLKKRVVENKNTRFSGNKQGGVRKVISQSEYEKKLAAQKNKTKLIPKKEIAPQKPAVKPEANQAVAKKAIADKAKSPTMFRSSAAEKALADKHKKIEAEKKAASLAKIMAEKKKAADLAAAKKAFDAKLLADKKKIEDQKIEAEKNKKIADQIAADTKKVIEKEIVVPKVEPVVVEESIAPVVSNQVESNQTEAHVSDGVSVGALRQEDDEDDIDLENISFVGSRDLEMMQIKEQIQAEIVKHYKPPVGISKKAVCELNVVVGVGGKAARATVKKGSGSVANDMCARAAALKALYPKEVIGKEITIALGQ